MLYGSGALEKTFTLLAWKDVESISGRVGSADCLSLARRWL